MREKSAGSMHALAVVTLGSFGLSYIIEILQIYQPQRFPALFDVLSNCAGGILGYFFYRWCLLTYFVASLVISILMQMQTDLSNWDKTFSLIVGNELTADRPWEGHVSEIFMLGRTITMEELAHVFSDKTSYGSIENSLLSSYKLTGTGDYHDTTGHLSELVWIGQTVEVLQDKGLSLGPHHWLKSAKPAEYLTSRIMESSQFTLVITAAAKKAIQTGPARIISLSADPSNRNFTLGQEEDNLIFRVRTPFTGDNGTPEVIVHDVFSTNETRKLVIAYDGSDLYIYVDSVSNSHIFEFSPGAVAFSLFSPIEISYLRSYKILWYALIFIPLSLMLLLDDTIRINRIWLISGGLLLLPCVMEIMLMIVSGRNLKIENLLISALFTAGPIVLYMIYRYLFFRES